METSWVLYENPWPTEGPICCHLWLVVSVVFGFRFRHGFRHQDSQFDISIPDSGLES